MAKGSRTRMVATLCLWTAIGFLGAGVLKTALPRPRANQVSNTEEHVAEQKAPPSDSGDEVSESEAQHAAETANTETGERQQEQASSGNMAAPPAAAEEQADVKERDAENLVAPKEAVPETPGDALVSRTPVAPPREPVLSDADFDSMYSAELERLGKIVEPLVK